MAYTTSADQPAMSRRHSRTSPGPEPGGTFNGNADALTLGLSGNTTVHDFEHAATLAGKDECKDGGWMTSTSPPFKNQGDCVSYFASAGKTHPNG
jgi:hypothetical protein